MDSFSAIFYRLLILISFITPELFAQEVPVYQKHNTYEQFINPAITGRDRYGFLNLSYRKNWIGNMHSPSLTALGGSFRLGTFNFYTPKKMLNKTSLIAKDRMGFGGLIMYGQNGPIGTFYSSLTYAYFVPFNKNKTTELSFGFSGLVMHNSVNESLLEPNDINDPRLLNLNNQPWMADGGFGVYFHTKQFQIGISANELFETSSTLDHGGFYQNQRDYFFQSGYKFYTRYADLEPFVYAAQIDDDPIYYYFQLKSYYKNYNWFSVGYKSTKSLLLSLGIKINRVQVGYTYEQNLNRLNNQFSWIHEIMIGFNIGYFEPEGIRKTVRK